MLFELIFFEFLDFLNFVCGRLTETKPVFKIFQNQLYENSGGGMINQHEITSSFKKYKYSRTASETFYLGNLGNQYIYI